MQWLIYGVGIFVLIFGFVVFRGAPYVPSHRRFVKKAFEDLYKITDKDVLVDAGSGDGVILRLAASRGARAIGYELNPVLVVISRLLARRNPRIEVKLADLWLAKFPQETTIIYVFAVSRDIEKVALKVQDFVDRRGEGIWCMTYGASFDSRKPVKTLKAHKLYRFEPLQPQKA